MVHSQKRKLGVIFLFVKTPNRGGVQGGLENHQTFPYFFVKPSLTYSTFVTLKCFNKYDFM